MILYSIAVWIVLDSGTSIHFSVTTLLAFLLLRFLVKTRFESPNYYRKKFIYFSMILLSNRIAAIDIPVL